MNVMSSESTFALIRQSLPLSLQVAGGVEEWWNHMPGFSASCHSAMRRIEGKKELERKLEGGTFEVTFYISSK